MSGFLHGLATVLGNDSFYRNAVVLAVVLLLAASGELVAERAGTINISLEGMMLAGGFAAALGAHWVHSTWVGLVAAMAAGAVVAVVQANLSHRLPADQFVVGLVLNVLVLGLVGFLTSEISPQSRTVRRLGVPVLSHIPKLGPALFDQPWVLYVVYPVVPSIGWLLYRTRWGLSVRAAGEDPNAADVSGIDVNAVRRRAIMLAGVMGGLAGGYLLFARAGRFEDSLIGGRGFVAIAAVIFGGWTLKGTVAGCSLFGMVVSLALTIPGLGFTAIDDAWLKIAPNALTILVMALYATRVRQPAALARPFSRGLR